MSCFDSFTSNDAQLSRLDHKLKGVSSLVTLKSTGGAAAWKKGGLLKSKKRRMFLDSWKADGIALALIKRTALTFIILAK